MPIKKLFFCAVFFFLLLAGAQALSINIVYGAGRYVSTDFNLTVAVAPVPALRPVIFVLNVPPNFEFWQVNGYDINGGLPYFNALADLDILLMAQDPDSNNLVMEDLNYSFSDVQGTGIVFYHNLDLNSGICVPPDRYPAACRVALDPTLLMDANYYVKGYIKDDINGFYAATLYTFAIDSQAPAVGSIILEGFFIDGSQIDGTGSIKAFSADVSSGIDITSCEYTLNNADWLEASWIGAACQKTGIEIEDGTEYSFNIRVSDIVGNRGEGTAANYTGNEAVPDPKNIENLELLTSGSYFGYSFIVAVSGLLFVLIALIIAYGLFVVAVKIF